MPKTKDKSSAGRKKASASASSEEEGIHLGGEPAKGKLQQQAEEDQDGSEAEGSHKEGLDETGPQGGGPQKKTSGAGDATQGKPDANESEGTHGKGPQDMVPREGGAEALPGGEIQIDTSSSAFNPKEGSKLVHMSEETLKRFREFAQTDPQEVEAFMAWKQAQEDQKQTKSSSKER
jgi:hypothetical protein